MDLISKTYPLTEVTVCAPGTRLTADMYETPYIDSGD